MHVALLSPSWTPGGSPNGIVTYVEFLRGELQRLGHRVSVFTGWTESDDPQNGIYLVPPISSSLVAKIQRRLSGQHGQEVYLWAQQVADKVREVHRCHPIDVIEMEESFGWFAEVQRLSGVPVVVKLHGPAFLSFTEDEKMQPGAQVKIESEGRALRNHSFITSPSRPTLQQTLDHYSLRPQRTAVIYNPVVPASPTRWSLDRVDRNAVLFVGRFDLRKGADVLLRAFKKVLEVRPQSTLTFVGPDRGLALPSGRIHFEEFCSQLFSPAERGRVTYVGQLRRTEVVPLRMKSLVTVMSSRWENLPYSGIEAMAEGCPTVMSAQDGMPITNGVDGLTSRPEDADAFAASILQLLANPEWAATLGARAASHIESNFAPKTIAQQTLRIYEAAVDTARSKTHDF